MEAFVVRPFGYVLLCVCSGTSFVTWLPVEAAYLYNMHIALYRAIKLFAGHSSME